MDIQLRFEHYRFLDTLSSSVFEEPKHEEPKPAEPNVGTNSVSISEPPLKEELKSPLPKVDDLEEKKDNVMEVSSVESTENLTSKEYSSNSEELLAPVPMEVDLLIPSSGVSSSEQAPNSSQPPIATPTSNNRKELETKPTNLESSEKEKCENVGEEVKEKEEANSAEQTETSMLNVHSDPANEPCVKDKVLNETTEDVVKLADQETVLLTETSPKDEEKSKNSEIVKGAAEENSQDETKVLNGKAVEIIVEKRGVENDKNDEEGEPQKMEIDAVFTDNAEVVKMDETTEANSTTPTSEAVSSTADTVAVPAQSSSAVVPKRPPLTEEQQAKKKELMDRCIHALEYCLRRFPQHHKSRYRLAYVFYYSPEHKVTQQFFQQDTLVF